MGEFLLLRVSLVNKDHLLGLIEVGDISVLVYATAEVPRSRPVSRTAANEIEKDMDILNDLSPNFES